MLTGERVTLRPVRESDLPVMYEWRLELATWGATTAVPPYGMTYDVYVERAKQTANDADKVVELVADVGGTVVGRASLFEFDLLSRSCEVGVIVAPAERGKGYGQECLRLMVGFAFRHRNCRRVHLQTLATNEAAIRCYEAVGFRHEGREREAAWVAGEYVDIVRMGLLDREWTA